jgi:valyl-tRNA synthetase
MPFVTEEIWQQLPPPDKGGSIMVQPLPEPDERFDDEEASKEMDLVIEIITAIRNIRGEMNMAPGEQIPVLMRAEESIQARIRKNQTYIQSLARVHEPVIRSEIEKPAASAYALAQGVEIFVSVDRSRMEEEVRRLEKERSKVEKEILFVNKKLSNEQFLSKAPADVVQAEKEKAMEYQAVKNKLEESLKKVKGALK